MTQKNYSSAFSPWSNWPTDWGLLFRAAATRWAFQASEPPNRRTKTQLKNFFSLLSIQSLYPKKLLPPSLVQNPPTLLRFLAMRHEDWFSVQSVSGTFLDFESPKSSHILGHADYSLLLFSYLSNLPQPPHSHPAVDQGRCPASHSLSGLGPLNYHSWWLLVMAPGEDRRGVKMCYCSPRLWIRPFLHPFLAAAVWVAC